MESPMAHGPAHDHPPGSDAPHEHGEAPHGHDAPDAPLVDHHVFATIRQVLRNSSTDRTAPRSSAALDAFDTIEEHFKSLDWLTELSRRSMSGQKETQQVLASWFEARSAAHEDQSRLQRVRTAHRHDAHAMAPEPLPGPQRSRSLGVNVRAIRQLFLGAVYATGLDGPSCTHALGLVQTAVSRSIDVLDLLHYHAVQSLGGLGHPETVLNLLKELPRGDDLTRYLRGEELPFEPGFPNPEINPILECLDVLREVTVGGGSAFETAQTSREDTLGLTALIVSVTPASVCAGNTVMLNASTTNPAKKFPANQPTDYGVFVDPCGTRAPVQLWTADAVTIVVPKGARSGCVRFGRTDESAGGTLAGAEQQALETFGACLGNFGLGRPGGLGTFTLNTTTLCPLTVCPPGNANYLEVRHKPEIVSFVAKDPAGSVIGTGGVEAGTVVIVSWQVRSDQNSGPLQISMSGARTLSALPSVGSLTLSAQDMRTSQALTLTATNSCDAEMAVVNISVFRKLYASPTPLTFLVGATAPLTLRSSCPVVSDVTVSLAASNPDASAGAPRVTVPASATILSGQDSVTVTVSATITAGPEAYVASLRHSQPASIVTATAPSHALAMVGVWVEPPRGQSSIALPSNPNNVVAVHMALLHTGKVLMFSADDTDFGHIDKVKTRVWDPITNAVVDPPYPYATHKNLFCAGHCFLPDGRLLVAAGHAIFAGGSAAKQVHTFDPIAGSWTRHAPMQKDRWYPTCVTLHDGRAIISSGSEGGGPPLIKGVVRDVEVFDSATNALTRFPDIHGDICMYPQMFVLPGGVLFFHSRNESWLFAPGPGTWSPTNGSWSVAIPTKSPFTRTYPGMAGCVLLPLLPEEGYAVRVLMAGGGGARESDMNGSTIASDSAEILDVDLSGNTGAWRDTNRAGDPLRVTTFRFMSDAVLLPDGTVFLVNGAAVGKADTSYVSVGFAELFDPQTETFRGFTPMSVPRHYHGNALLLPDGRVAVAGHTWDFNKPPLKLNRFEVEVVAPPYLFRGPRPTITNVTHAGLTVGYGQSVTVSTDRPADIGRVALIRQGSSTHQLNTDQRYVGLVITQRGTNSLTVTAPPDGGVAPPGHYMLFLVDKQGVPSRGQFVRVG